MKKHVLICLLLAAAFVLMTACGTAQPQTAPTASPEPAEEPAEESVSEEDIFLQFLRGETEAVVEEPSRYSLSYIAAEYDHEAGGVRTAFEGAESISFEGLRQSVREDAHSASGMETYYAITETLSGKKVLAVRFLNLGIDDPAGDDGSYAAFFFAVNDGRLAMTYAYDSWSRSWTEINDGMIFTGHGSSGAGDSSEYMYALDVDGHCGVVYELRALGGPWVAMYAWEIFSYDDTDWSTNCVCYLLRMGRDMYYVMEGEDTADPEKLAAFIGYLEDQHMTRIEDAGPMIDVARAVVGIPDEPQPFAAWLPWDME